MYSRGILPLCLLSCLLNTAKLIAEPDQSIYSDITNRVSSAPFISGDTFRSFADHVIDETGMPFNPDAVRPGDSIFILTDYLPFFFRHIHHLIQAPYVLITHNSDSSAPFLVDFNGVLSQEPYPVDLHKMLIHTPIGNNVSFLLKMKRLLLGLQKIQTLSIIKLFPYP